MSEPAPANDVDYVRGGLAAPVGQGIFVDAVGEGLQIWVDPALPGRSELLPLMTAEGAQISSDHTEPDTRLLILHPSSISIFDQYCHPAWLPVRQRARHKRWVKNGGREEWKRKVVLTAAWPSMCLRAGRYLGVEDDWGGCRKGGPPLLPRSLAGVIDQIHAVKQILAPSLSPVALDTAAAQTHTEEDAELLEADMMMEQGETAEEEAEAEPTADDRDQAESVKPLQIDNSTMYPAVNAAFGEDRDSSPADMDIEPPDSSEAATLPNTAPVAAPTTPSNGAAASNGARRIPSWKITGNARASKSTRNTGIFSFGTSLTDDVSKYGGNDASVTSSLAENTSNEGVVDSQQTRGRPPKFKPLAITPLDIGPSRPGPLASMSPQATTAGIETIESVPSDGYLTDDTSVASRQAIDRPGKGRPLQWQSGPKAADKVSRWQLVSKPPKILAGLRFYVMKGRYGRKATRANIIESGGSWVNKLSEATHSLNLPVYASTPDEEGDEMEVFRRVIRDHPETWFVGFDWLESSWDAGKLLPEMDYAYEGSNPKTHHGATDLDDTPDDALKGGKSGTRTRPGLPESAPQTGPPAGLGRLSVEHLDHIFRAHHPLGQQPGKGVADVVQRILLSYDDYSEREWDDHYRMWRTRTGKFAYLDTAPASSVPSSSSRPSGSKVIASAVRPDNHIPGTSSARLSSAASLMAAEVIPPKPPAPPERMTREEQLRNEFDAYGRVFQPCQQLLEQGISRSDIGVKLAADNPGYGLTGSTWCTYFGNWLRGVTVKTSKPMPPRSSRPRHASPSPTIEHTLAHLTPRERLRELARLFRRFYDSPVTHRTVVGEALAAQTGYSPERVATLYTDWRRGVGHFETIPVELRYSGPPTRAYRRVLNIPPATTPAPSETPSIKRSESGTKRSLELESNPGTPNKRPKNSYTDAEEANMAVYITRRLPESTHPTARDWADFAKENPARTHAAWVEHYRVYKARINALVAKLGGQIPGKRTPSSRRTRQGSSDSVEFVAHKDKRSTSKDVEIVEVLDSDNE